MLGRTAPGILGEEHGYCKERTNGSKERPRLELWLCILAHVYSMTLLIAIAGDLLGEV